MQQESQFSSKQWFTIKEAAKYVKVSRFTIHRWIRDKKIITKVLPNGRKLIKKSSLGLSDSEYWFTINEAAQYLGVSRKTVNNWLRKGKISFETIPSGLRRIKKEELDKKVKEKYHTFY